MSSQASTTGLTIGIDLGTTRTCFATGGKNPKIVPNIEGEHQTRSVVAYTKDGQILTGTLADRQRTTNPDYTFYAFKRLMGHALSEIKEKDRFSYPLSAAKNGDVRVSALVDGQEKSLSPEELSAQLLNKVKEDAEKYLDGKVTQCVITVPAYFNDRQRQATKDAGKIAGLEVLRIINEPTAAALAYGLDQKPGDRKIAVYDLGGGTFDVSIIEICDVDGEHQFEVLATNGDTFLGGEDFDNALLNHVADTFKKEHGVDLRGDSMAFQRLKEASEKAKIELSTTLQTEVNLPFITANQTGPLHLNVKITRAEFEGLVKALVDRSMEPCRVALKDSGLKPSEIDDVILVGGQTRMPAVQEAVKQFFGKEPLKSVNPDEAVAAGAAIQAGVLTGEVKDVLLLDVTPLSLGIETLGGVMTKLIEKNTTIPTKATQVFSTAEDNQTAVTIHVLQGEREMASANKSLGRFDLTDIPPSPRGMPQIEVAFDIDANGIIHVSAKDKASGKAHSIVIKSAGGLSDEDIERMIRDAEENAEADKAFHELVQVRNEADALIHQSEKALKDLEDVTDEERQSVESAIESLKAVKNSDDLEAIRQGMEALKTASARMGERLYAKQAQQAQAEGEAGSSAESQADDGKTMDAEFEDVDS